MTDEKLRNELGRQGRQRAVENFDYRTVARKFLQLIDNRLNIS